MKLVGNLRNKITMLETYYNPDINLSSDEVIIETKNKVVKSYNVIIFKLSE